MFRETRSSLIMVCLILFILCIFSCRPNENYDYSFVSALVKGNDSAGILYIKARKWGLTGDGQEIAISHSNVNETSWNSHANYVYKGLSPFFYAFRHDTLYVYVRKAVQVPSRFRTKMRIVQVELTNTQMMDLVENENYKKKGLKTIETNDGQ